MFFGIDGCAPPFHPTSSPDCKTSKIIRMKAVMPWGKQFPTYQQHIHEHSLTLGPQRNLCSNLQLLKEHENDCPEIRNQASCYISLQTVCSQKDHRDTIEQHSKALLLSMYMLWCLNLQQFLFILKPLKEIHICESRLFSHIWSAIHKFDWQRLTLASRLSKI